MTSQITLCSIFLVPVQGHKDIPSHVTVLLSIIVLAQEREEQLCHPELVDLRVSQTMIFWESLKGPFRTNWP